LVLWNPLLLVDGVMTPHLDLLMAAALAAGLLAWTRRREPIAVGLLSLSIGIKLITALLVPAALLSMGVAGLLRGRRGSVLIWTVAVSGTTSALLWSSVWQPFLQHGLRGSLEISSTTALLPNVITALQASRVLSMGPDLDPLAVTKSLRWFAFAPFWAAGTAMCVVLARRWSQRLPDPLFESLGLLLLGYHVLFTVWVLPWHFTTALCLCLLAASPRGITAGLLVTASGVLFHVNEGWVWDHPWQDPQWISWILGISMQMGPIVAAIVLLRAMWTQCHLGIDAGSATCAGRPAPDGSDSSERPCQHADDSRAGASFQ